MPQRNPNIVYFLTDDLGYGDVSCLNPDGKIPTPNVDRLAAEGVTFTDAHSTSAVCSPSRYSVLTGRYNWRSTLQSFIVRQYGDPLIDKDRLTVAGMLREAGYYTAAVGKWHLGQGWDFEVTDEFLPAGDHFNNREFPGNPPVTEQTRALWREAFSKPTTGGPTTRGFDYYFGVDVPNWPPYCYIENDRTVGTPSEYLPPRLLGSNQASNPGPAMPYWHFQQLLPKWAEKAEEVMDKAIAAEKPFFLYLPVTSPHTPLSPNAKWVGASGLDSPYADLVMETDAIFGQVLDALEARGLRENTLVVFASDNGFAKYVGGPHLEAQGHFPSAGFRGYKSDAWDGGHRIPFIASLPGTTPAGSTCNELVCLSDLMATCADLIDVGLPENAGEDSVSLLPLLRGGPGPVRDYVIHHSIQGKFAIRDGKWKLVLCPGSGGWELPDTDAAESGLPLVQLYDMEADPGEQNNLEATDHDRVRRMINVLEDMVARGRSTPGPDQSNDVEIDIWKFETMPSVDIRQRDRYQLDDY